MNQIQPKNYLVESILVTIFCCQPFGIISIVYASQVNSKYALGDYEGAKIASQNAKKWMNWGIIAAVVLVVGILILYGSFLATLISSNTF
jgi:ABC-type multidrug transport system permease subunit